MKTCRSVLWILISVLIHVLLLVWSLSTRLEVTWYRVPVAKLTAELRVAVVADLHGAQYGEGQVELLDAIERAEVDLVVMPGDIIDERVSREDAYTLVEALASRYPTFYSTGNHEGWTHEPEVIRAEMARLGAKVLTGTGEEVRVDGQTLQVLGLDDPDSSPSYRTQLAQLEAWDGTLPTLLLAHRPERYGTYQKIPADVIFSGHAHGGQWRIPLLGQGIFAPGQGFFPRWTAGVVEEEAIPMVISRGLSKDSTRIPRIWNRPELVIVELTPE